MPSLFSTLQSPSGSMQPYAGGSIPNGWALCNGDTVSRTSYPQLFLAIGTSWGNGDGATTFHLPNIQGRTLRGVDNGDGTDPDAAGRSSSNPGGNTGDNVGSIQSDATAPNGLSATSSGSHIHGGGGLDNFIGNPINGTYVGPFGQLGQFQGEPSSTQQVATTSNGAHSHTVSGGGAESRMKNANTNFIIRL